MTFIFEVIKMKIVNIVTLILNIIGGINWGLIGLFKFDLVAWICGGQDSVFARIIYSLVGLSAIWCISLLFSNKSVEEYNKANSVCPTLFALILLFYILKLKFAL